MTLNDDKTAVCSPDKVIDDYHKNYFCTLTTKSRDKEYGQFDINTKAELITGDISEINIEHWLFFNPVIALSIDGDIIFDSVRTGTDAYSSTLLVGNDADDSSGVPINLYISGTNLTDSSKIGENLNCPGGIKPSDISYFASNGARSTKYDPRADNEGYIPLTENMQMVILNSKLDPKADTLYPGAEMPITFRIRAPQNCIGGFDEGYVTFSANPIDNTNEIVTSSITPNVIIIPVCSSNIECNDNNDSTYDRCINPGKSDSYCLNNEVSCYNDNDCGFTGLIGDNFCSENNVFKLFQTSQCVNPGTITSYCQIINQSQLIQDCGNNSCDEFSPNYCNNGDSYHVQTCYNNGCSDGNCFSNQFYNEILVENCSDYCWNGSCKTFTCRNNSDCNDNNLYTEDKCINPSTSVSECTHEKITCLTNKDCGNDIFKGKQTCQNDSVFQNSLTYTCINPNTANSSCLNSTFLKLKQDCGKDYCNNYTLQCKGNNWCSNSDTNKDGKVNLNDLQIYWNNLGKKDCSLNNNWCKGADVNKDSKVDVKDLRLIMGKFGRRDCVKSTVYQQRRCFDKGCKSGSCFTKSFYEGNIVQDCDNGCKDGNCN